MKKHFLWIVLMLSMSLGAFAQTTMTDQQVMALVMEEHEKGATQSQIVTKLMQRGVDIQQIRRVRSKYERQIKQSGMGQVADEAVDNADKRLRQGQKGTPATKKNKLTKKQNVQPNLRMNGVVDPTQQIDPTDPEFLQMQAEMGGLMPVDSIALLEQLLEQQRAEKKKVFGRDIFNNENLSFEPNMNIATPQDYRLGPGDVVNIDIYGASQQSLEATVTPDGDIVVDGFGPIAVSGLTVSQASARVRSQLGARYSSSQIKLTVGQTKTIMVNVMGEVTTPGTYTISAFATVFNALYMAGGINDIGTLRNIKVYRHNRLVTTVDIYDYILNGQARGNVRLIDNDVIIVGAYDCLVNLTGKAKRPMYYEMKKDESLAALLKYGGGFAGDAYTKTVRVVRKAGALHSVHTVNEFDYSAFKLADGDSVAIDSTIARYSNMAEVKGAVFRPGMYQIGGGVTSVRTLIEAAEGATEEAFTPHAVMHRMKDDRTLEVLSVDVAGIMEGRLPDVPLRNEDVLYVPTRQETMEEQTLTIYGEVQFPGIYKYADNETIEDFILQAGGLTDAASIVKVDVSRRLIDPSATSASDTIAISYSFKLKDGFVIDGENGFVLQPYDQVYVRRSPGYNEQVNVSVEGEVQFEGAYTLTKKSERISEIIAKAGGLTKTAFAKGARLMRQRTEEEKARQNAMLEAAKRSQSGGKDSIDIKKLDISETYSVGIELDKALANPGSDDDVVLRAGDRIIVPEYPSTVKINGEVMYPNTVSFLEGKDLKYYINQAGGWGENAKKSQTYIIYMNGTIAKASRKNKPKPGCEIVVPIRQRGGKLTTTEVLAIGTSTASLATMFATIANVLK